VVGKQTIGENTLVFDRYRHLALPSPVIDRSVEQVDGHTFRIRLRSKMFVKGCTLSFGRKRVALSDNCFDLIPGEAKTVTCNTGTKMDLKAFNSVLKIRSVHSLKTAVI
jgi:hypothetical protein